MISSPWQDPVTWTIRSSCSLDCIPISSEGNRYNWLQNPPLASSSPTDIHISSDTTPWMIWCSPFNFPRPKLGLNLLFLRSGVYPPHSFVLLCATWPKNTKPSGTMPSQFPFERKLVVKRLVGLTWPLCFLGTSLRIRLFRILRNKFSTLHGLVPGGGGAELKIKQQVLDASPSFRWLVQQRWMPTLYP